MMDPCQVIFYGPFKVDGKHTSESNAEFEKWLTDKDASYGIRDIAEIDAVAKANGFKLIESHMMPSNNFLNIFTRN